jgi:hypothetical protein
MIDADAVDQDDGGPTSSTVKTVVRPSSGHTKSLLLSISDGGFEVGVLFLMTCMYIHCARKKDGTHTYTNGA